jgi:hypothetical protein
LQYNQNQRSPDDCEYYPHFQSVYYLIQLDWKKFLVPRNSWPCSLAFSGDEGLTYEWHWVPNQGKVSESGGNLDVGGKRSFQR